MGTISPFERRQRSPKDFKASVEELRSLLQSMATSIVDHPEEVVVHCAENENAGFVSFEVMCAESDVGAVLGKRGSNADAMRVVLLAAASARRIRVSAQFLSSQGEGMPRR